MSFKIIVDATQHKPIQIGVEYIFHSLVAIVVVYETLSNIHFGSFVVLFFIPKQITIIIFISPMYTIYS